MKNLLKRLPALALALVAVAAFAFNMPDNQAQFAQDRLTGEWYDLTNVTPGPNTYECDADPEVCIRTQPNSGAPMITQGLFIVNGELPKAN